MPAFTRTDPPLNPNHPLPTVHVSPHVLESKRSVPKFPKTLPPTLHSLSLAWVLLLVTLTTIKLTYRVDDVSIRKSTGSLNQMGHGSLFYRFPKCMNPICLLYKCFSRSNLHTQEDEVVIMTWGLSFDDVIKRSSFYVLKFATQVVGLMYKETLDFNLIYVLRRHLLSNFQKIYL